MGAKGLAESIILQSMEDLWSESPGVREDCIAFFRGEGFNTCARMAGMNLSDQSKLLNMVSEIIRREGVRRKVRGDAWRRNAKMQQKLLEKLALTVPNDFLVPKGIGRQGELVAR